MRKYDNALSRAELKELNNNDLRKMFLSVKKIIEKRTKDKEIRDDYKAMMAYKSLVKEEMDLRVSRAIEKKNTVETHTRKTLEELGFETPVSFEDAIK